MGQVGGGFNGHFLQCRVSTACSGERQVSWISARRVQLWERACSRKRCIRHIYIDWHGLFASRLAPTVVRGSFEICGHKKGDVLTGVAFVFTAAKTYSD